ncbi:PAS domain S-box protein [Mariprofundus sp. KV]|uniref:PAS domain S-box protein n=1 Tax=Mariprofundus sp. KV TaxID=2608715 RepID=UPI0015A08E2F|nr:PAS domain S-box protein [Mariprofundus sp. KV]NWF36318.1 PAS domain S-box protein [Mariprofundus sp. KV]
MQDHTQRTLNNHSNSQFKTGILRYFLAAFLPLALLIVSAAYAIYVVDSNGQIKLKVQQNQSMIKLQTAAITQDFTLIASDILFLAAESELQEAFEEGDTEHLQQASIELKNFVKAKKIYDQIRFIDNNGMERIRINFDGTDASIVPVDKLQSKADRYYFTEALKLKAGEIYISPLDLNIENGEVEQPYKPMIRFTTPVMDSRGNRLGFLVSNYYGQVMLDHFIGIHTEDPELSHLVNSDGYWLHSNPHGLEWGFMFADKKQVSFKHAHAEAWQQINTRENGHIELDKGIYCFTTINPLHRVLPDYQITSLHQVGEWKVISFDSRADLNAMLANTKNIISIWTIISLLLASIISGLLARAISSRKIAEATAHQADLRMKEAVRTALDGIITIDHDDLIVSLNRSAETIFGISSSEVIGKCLSETIMPERFREMHRKGMARYLEDRESLLLGRRMEAIARHSDGHEFPIELSITVIEGEAQPLFTAFIRDLTEQKKADDKIRKLSRAIEQAGESIIITDHQGSIEYVNPAFCDITGYQSDEIIGQNPRILNSGEQNRRFYQEMWRTIKAGENWQGRIVDRRKDGSVFPAILNISPIFDENNNITHFIGLQQNLQEYEELEERFQQAQKMEAIGTLVGGIAHDFNNTLAGIIGNLYLIKRKVSDQPTVVSRVETIETLASRASEMIQQLMAFSRRSVINMQQINLPPFIKETAKLHEVSIPENIKLELTIKEEAMYIHADANQLQQMLFNLVNNARDALDDIDSPVISLSLKRYIADNKFQERHPETEIMEFALISVADNGAGIEAENLEHIFEPFFTTKAVGQGTGLGLSMVYGAVQAHGGCIEVDSRKGKGTCFNIYLPLLSSNIEETATSSLYVTEIMDGEGETILLVDDDTLLVNTVREILEDMKYNIITASNGREAIDAFIAHRHEIKLIIMDVVMPQLGGVEALLEIRKVEPAIPCIFTTGYDRSKVLEQHGMANVESVLTKPYEVFDLARLVNEKLR